MPIGYADILGFYLGWQSALLIDCVVQDIKRTHDIVPFTVNRQGKWDTFKTEVNGHLGACSSPGKPVDYGLKEGVSHGVADHRPLLAG
jgi:hypothetical protein